MVGVLCITAFAANEPADDVVLRVSALKRDGTTEFIEDYKNFEDGWNDAMELADDADEMKTNNYDRIVVDLYADWTAVDGEFTDDYWNGPGFDWDTIYFQDDVRFTLNMNGHTIDRAMTTWQYNGEVMTIDEDADVIINNGTIKGGWSSNGAGGIHIHDGANVTLNNVNVTGNTADDDDGGGIAVYDGATLTMNGGSLKDNYIDSMANGYKGVAVYVEDSVAIFNDVEFKNNQAYTNLSMGAAVYATNSQITLNRCTIDGNGNYDKDKEYHSPKSLITLYDNSMATIKDCSFTNNGAAEGHTSEFNAIRISTSALIMDNSEFKNNDFIYLIDSFSSSVYVSNTKFIDNLSAVMHANYSNPEDSYFRNCTFNNNVHDGYYSYYAFEDIYSTVTFYDCDLGDSTFDHLSNVKIEDTNIPDEEVALSVGMLLSDGEIVPVKKYRDPAIGWNAAMELAASGKETGSGSTRVVVDLYTDWTAVDGEFCNSGTGFDWDAIYFPQNVSVTLNLNGHTINRAMTSSEMNGEVMCIDANADVIINGGKITGGWSSNGAGGIHIKDDANVVLNNVNVDANSVTGDIGAAIAVLDGATLTMNGGSLSNNKILHGGNDTPSYGALYVEDATAVLNNVVFNGNVTDYEKADGVAIYADDADVTMVECTFTNNAVMTEGTNYAVSVIYVTDSTLTSTNCNFEGNGSYPTSQYDNNYVIKLDDGIMTMEGGKFSGNESSVVIGAIDSDADIKNVTVTDNESGAIRVYGSSNVSMTACTLGNNAPIDDSSEIKVENKGALIMTDCTLGDTTFEDASYVQFVYSSVSEAEAVIGISMLLADGTLTSAQYYKDFAYGWSYAIESALKNNCDRIVVDLYADWTAVNGEFCDSGTGFNWDAIYFPAGVRVTLNMNGHTINRAMTTWEYNGEVMYVDTAANVIINDGTITGGWSCNGAGGIHINDNANVTLNNVNVTGNQTTDDDGAGIAAYDGATLTMNGGSLSSNTLHIDTTTSYGAGLWLYDATAVLNNVTISGNQAAHGAAVALNCYGAVTLNECIVENNNTALQSSNNSIFYSELSGRGEFYLSNTVIRNNGNSLGNVFKIQKADVTMTDCTVSGNNASSIFDATAAHGSFSNYHVSNTKFVDNNAMIADYKVIALGSGENTTYVFEKCTFNNNSSAKFAATFFCDDYTDMTMTDCDLGDSTFQGKEFIKFVDSSAPDGVGSIFGEGSLAMIVAFVSLIAVGVSIWMNVSLSKKIYATATDADVLKDEETEDESAE